MGYDLWRKSVFIMLGVSVLMTVFCVTPGPGLWLANQKWYITFISHVALVLSMLGVIAGMRAEREAQNGD